MFKDNSVEEGYPRPVTDFGLPRTGVDGAFSWSHDQKTYFFKDGLHWRYDEAAGHMDKGFPTQDTPWGPMPSPVDDVLSGNNGESPQPLLLTPSPPLVCEGWAFPSQSPSTTLELCTEP